MNILKTCLKAGHRWGRPVRVDRQRWWIEIARCQRRLCGRLRFEDSNGNISTYDLRPDGSTGDYVTIAKSGLPF